MYCNTKLPSSDELRGISILAKNGTMVTDTKREAKTVVITAIGRLRINSPEASGKKVNGRKAKIKVAVQPTTARPICLVAKIAASFRG